MPNDAYIRDKSAEQILSELYGTAQPGSVVHEQQLAAIRVRSTADIVKALNGLNETITAANKGGDVLQRRLWWLSLGVALATAVGAAATVLQAYAAFRH